jgi:hypothetical protein
LRALRADGAPLARLARRALVALLALTACGGGGAVAADADPNAPDADPKAPDADPSRPDAAPSPGSPDAAPVAPALPTCWLACATAADCAQPGELFGADNYRCEDGTCRWTGCNSTAECTATFMSSGYACATFADAPLPTCYPTCSSAADCASASDLFGADNYTCDGGKCRWTGCNSTAECTSTFMNAGYVCR